MTVMDNVMAPQAITRSADHRYLFEGIWYPGVTNIIECLGATFTVASRYGANQCAETVAELLEQDALRSMYDTLGREGFVKGIAASAVKRRDEAAQRGTDVHTWAERIANGHPAVNAPESLRQRPIDYAEWWQASGWQTRLTEGMVVKPTDGTPVLGWGGTFDLLAYDADGRTVLADVKTGNLYPKAVVQLAGYSLAKWVQFTDGKVYPMPKIDRYVILHVTTAGVREVEVSVGTAEHMAFLACLDLHHWTESMKGKRL